MRKLKVVSGYVVYRPRLSGGGHANVAVCEQEEWDEMEAADPGRHLMLRGGIVREADAEGYARGLQPPPPPKGKKPKPKVPPVT